MLVLVLVVLLLHCPLSSKWAGYCMDSCEGRHSAWRRFNRFWNRLSLGV